MAESPRSDASHDSGNDSNDARAGKAAAVKDKKCQYCNQPFTSSSLGRHLDQFLTKKKPDGIHDVDEIRRLRGGITRRTARHGKAHDNDEGSKTSGTPVPGHVSPPTVDRLNSVGPGGQASRINALDWHTTGVINDISSLSPSVLNPPTKRSFSAFAADTATQPDKDTNRALELALREVLDSVQAATTRAAPHPNPFDFELQSQTFPALCLMLLPHPPTLFSPSPFASSTSCSLNPPGQNQLELLRLNLSNKIHRWKWDHLRLAQTLNFPTATSANLGEEADYLTRSAQQYEEMTTKHLDLAYSTWTSHPPDVRAQLWLIELMRAFVKEQSKTGDLEQRIEQITQEANLLQGQVEHLSRCQWPREMALWPPERVRFSKAEVREMHCVSPGNSASLDAEHGNRRGEKWDFDRLVGKWKKHVREDKSRRGGVAAATQQASISDLERPTSHRATNVLPPQRPLDVNGGHVNGAGSASDDGRRKSMRQLQLSLERAAGEEAHLVGTSADKTDEQRELMLELENMKSR